METIEDKIHAILTDYVNGELRTYLNGDEYVAISGIQDATLAIIREMDLTPNMTFKAVRKIINSGIGYLEGLT